jgi:DNA-binding transcriptional regulator YdaS (Cro superfamily)
MSTTPDTKTLIKQLGGPAKVAAHFNDLSPQAVSQWKRIPQERVRKIAELTGVSPAQLRPDLAEALAA